MKICDFRTRLEQSVKLFLQTPLVKIPEFLQKIAKIYSIIISQNFARFWPKFAGILPEFKIPTDRKLEQKLERKTLES